MDEDKIEVVLARTSELRSKIISCVRRTSDGGVKDVEGSTDSRNREVDAEEEAESLLNIRDALNTLEGQLSSLQALQQKQWYEKGAALAELEHGQNKLLKELNQYKGKNMELINEAISFAAEFNNHHDLLLQPYSTRNSSQNEVVLEKDQRKTVSSSSSSSPFQRAKIFISSTAKTSLTILGVVAILSLTGFELRPRKKNSQFQLVNVFRHSECPNGMIPIMMENSELRCVVKERIEVPFDSTVASPDVSYGFG